MNQNRQKQNEPLKKQQDKFENQLFKPEKSNFMFIRRFIFINLINFYRKLSNKRKSIS